MPYLSSKIKLPKEFDRRYKIKDEEKKDIIEMYKTGAFSIRAIARKYKHISRRSIQLIIFPDRKEKIRLRAKEVKRWEKYNKKEYHTPVMRSHRHYKQQLYLEGKI